jgi:hypothetical protein
MNNSSRLCADCAEPLSQARLNARPDAIQCVSCLTNCGDVAPIRRFDEYIGDDQRELDVVEHYYTKPNQYLAGLISRYSSGNYTGQYLHGPAVNQPNGF